MLYHSINRIAIFLLLLLWCVNAFAQHKYLSITEAEGLFHLHDISANDTLLSTDEVVWLNYNALLKVESMPEYKLFNSSSIHMFSVFYTPGMESCLWSLSSDDSQIISTQNRLIDLDQGNYLNYRKAQSGAHLLTYNSSNSRFTFQKIQFADWDADFSFPIRRDAIWLGESLFFEHTLSPIRSKAFQSAFIIKYGLFDNSDLTFLCNSDSQVFWTKNQDFPFGISGICRDDKALLNQKQSVSNGGNYTFAIGLNSIEKSNDDNENELNNLDYLVWSSNQNKLLFEPDFFGQEESQTQWLFKTNMHTSDLTMEIESAYLNAISNNKNVWVQLNDFQHNSLGQRDYIKLIKEEKLMKASNVNLSDSQTAKLIVSNNFLLDYELHLEPCESGNESKAILDFRIIACDYPIKVELKQETAMYDLITVYDDSVNTISFSRWGKHHMVLTDSNGLIEVFDIIVNPDDLLNIDIGAIVESGIQDNGWIDLSGIINEHWSVVWTRPDKSNHNGLQLLLDQNGTYEVSIDSGHCQFIYEFSYNDSSDRLLDSRVYPNPSSTGYFNIEAMGDSEFILNYTLVDVNGKVIRQSSSDSMKFHELQLNILDAGVYFLKLESSQGTSTFKLIVQP